MSNKVDEVFLSIVIPIYNERENIQPLYYELKQVLSKLNKSYEIIFVDDGSNDGSTGELLNLYKKDKAIKVIKLRRNFGQSIALKTGFEFAKGKFIISMDGDLQNDPNDIPKLLEKINEGFDVVCGWRINRKDNKIRVITSKLGNFIKNFITGVNIHDTGCTLRIYKSDCIKGIELLGELHRFLPVILWFKGYKITEIPINHRKRKYGKSKYSTKRLLKAFFDLISIVLWYKYRFKLIHIIGYILITYFIVSLVFCIIYKNLTLVIFNSIIFILILFFILSCFLDMFFKTSFSKKELEEFIEFKLL